MKARWKIGERVHIGSLSVNLVGNAPEFGVYWSFWSSDEIYWPFVSDIWGEAYAESEPFPTREAALEDAKAQGITWEG